MYDISYLHRNKCNRSCDGRQNKCQTKTDKLDRLTDKHTSIRTDGLHMNRNEYRHYNKFR